MKVMKVANVYTRGKRGRKPLPLQEKVAGRVLEALGGRKTIFWLLTEGGETMVSLVRDSTHSHCSREWARVLISKELDITAPRQHGLVWHIVALFPHSDMNLEDRKRQAAVASRFIDQKWITGEMKKSGSFEELAQKCGFPEEKTRTLRNFLVGAGLHIPRKTAMPVPLKCAQCGKRFHREVWVHERRLRLRKFPHSFCSRPCFYRFRKEQYGRGEK